MNDDHRIQNAINALSKNDWGTQLSRAGNADDYLLRIDKIKTDEVYHVGGRRLVDCFERALVLAGLPKQT